MMYSELLPRTGSTAKCRAPCLPSPLSVTLVCACLCKQPRAEVCHSPSHGVRVKSARAPGVWVTFPRGRGHGERSNLVLQVTSSLEVLRAVVSRPELNRLRPGRGRGLWGPQAAHPLSEPHCPSMPAPFTLPRKPSK